MGRGRSKGVKGGSSTASINQAAPAATPTAPIITPQAGQASSDGTLMAVQPTVIHTYFSRQYASYGDEVTVAKTDGNGNLTFTRAYGDFNTDRQGTGTRTPVDFTILHGSVNDYTVGINWSAVQSISGLTYNIRNEAKKAGLRWDSVKRIWRR